MCELHQTIGDSINDNLRYGILPTRTTPDVTPGMSSHPIFNDKFSDIDLTDDFSTPRVNESENGPTQDQDEISKHDDNEPAKDLDEVSKHDSEHACSDNEPTKDQDEIPKHDDKEPAKDRDERSKHDSEHGSSSDWDS